MKGVILFFLLMATSALRAQNEFAATAFYNDFNKIYEDAKAGFALNKGIKKNSEFPELATEYRANLLLPLADSGKIVFPVSENRPYVIYYFEPAKMSLKINQRALNLRNAVMIAFNRPLFSRTETTLINNHPFTNSYYYTDPSETRAGEAEFRMTIYFENGRYNLSFEIRGRKVK